MRDRRPGHPQPALSPCPAPRTARQVVFCVLDEWKRTGAFVTATLDRLLGEVPLEAADRRLAHELTVGVVKRQATLNAVLEHCVTRPRHLVEGRLWTLLQLGAYQLLLLRSIPPHAAVDETVELARWIGKPRWCGLANAVLRRVAALSTGEPADAPASDTLPLADGTWLRLREPVFADPQVAPIDWFAAAMSFPRWLVERWQHRAAFDELLRWGFYFNSPPALTLRVNTLRTTRETLLAAFTEAGIHAGAGNLPESIRVESSVRIDELPGYEAGWFTVQDESAMLAVDRLAPQPGERILDLCAAPGGKTTHLAERMNNRGTIVACDIRPERLARAEENCRRLGITIVQTRLVAADGSDLPEGPFDAVLVDVPCSNTGVLNRRPEVRWRLKPADLRELPRLQKRLLENGLERLAPTGRALYATCSIEPEENQRVVEVIRRRHHDVSLVGEWQLVPGEPADGGYQALLQRSEA